MMALALQVALAQPPPARRVALVAGANDGGPGRARLRYATSDARSMGEVLVELGGVEPGHLVSLADPTVAEFRASLAQLDVDGERTQLFVYYSGHSDESGLLLGDGRYRYADLRSDLDALQADIRIAVLDSCSSGAMVLGKGGAAVPAFLVDTSSQVSGHAFLTSSSADEVSQEAGRIGGSFFTHALVSGLRGAADTDQDQRVTLQEAYDFAHAETLARTESTQRGSQHPQYEFDLTGSGDLVLTDLAASTSGLRLPAGVSGRVALWGSDGRLTAELFKPVSRPLEIGLPPGRYRVVLEEGELLEGRVDLLEGQLALLDVASLRAVRRLPTTPRGGPVRSRPAVVQHWPTDRDQGVRDHLAFGLVAGASELRGFSFGLGGSLYEGDVSGMHSALGASQARGTLRGWQAGIVYNGAGHLRGLQTGLVNHATDADGFQLGMVNHAGSLDGLAVGLVNVAETGNGVPIGLLNIVRDGILDVELWSSDASPVNVSLKSGTRRAFTSLIVGYDPGDPYGVSSAGGSLGVRALAEGPFTWDLDLAGIAHFPEALHGDDVVTLVSLRTQVGIDFVERFGVFAGVSLGGHASMQVPDATVTNMPAVEVPIGDTTLRLHPGWFAGVRF